MLSLGAIKSGTLSAVILSVEPDEVNMCTSVIVVTHEPHHNTTMLPTTNIDDNKNFQF